MTISSIFSSPVGINFLFLSAPVIIFIMLVHLFPSIENVATAVGNKLNEDSFIMNILNSILVLIYVIWFIAFSIHGLLILFFLQILFICGGCFNLFILFTVILFLGSLFGGLQQGYQYEER